MRHAGTLTDWKDDKGFGFITPDGDGTKLFVHVGEFERGPRRPRVGDRVEYSLDTGPDKGPRARRVRFADATTATGPGSRAPRLRLATVVAAGFLAVLAVAFATRRLEPYVLVAYGVLGVASFALYAIDKAAARDGRRRVPEGTLHFLDTLGGWPGGAFAQQWLRHKSSKRRFAIGYWMSVAINVAGAVAIATVTPSPSPAGSSRTGRPAAGAGEDCVFTDPRRGCGGIVQAGRARRRLRARRVPPVPPWAPFFPLAPRLSPTAPPTCDTLDYSLGCRLPLADWLALNGDLIFEKPELRRFVAPFPPVELMKVTTGVGTEKDFAVQGALLFKALSAASPVPLHEFPSLLDFGCGSGRLARIFKGFPGRLAGCDIDPRLVAWCQSSLDYMDVRRSSVMPPTPFADGEFAAIVSISIFTHLTEACQDAFLDELARISRPDALLFLSTHGDRTMERAKKQPHIRAMLNVPDAGFEQACVDFEAGRHAFVLQPTGHLTTLIDKQLHAGKVIDEPYEYGITLLSEAYIRSHWSRWFEVVDYRSGAIHDFQDIVVLRPRPRPAPVARPGIGAKLKSAFGSMFGLR
jgi:uncharacterized membrane protein YsdA (DUF1294 family)/cold shock CspA family protein/SAM-dependent methyltransferase